MMSPRRFLFGSTALVLLALLVTLSGSRSVSSGARNRADEAAVRLESFVARDSGRARAVSLAYLERARLGLGSPFRLIDLALHDPRLSDSVRVDVAWSILGRMLDDSTYRVDPRALDLVNGGADAARHLAIIETHMADADDPRVAETTVRLAYGLAAANGTASMGAMPVAAEVAAQLRDRALARRDLRLAVSRAHEDGVDLLEEIVHLRTTRELAVESPLFTALTAPEREAALDAVPALLARIESDRTAGSSPAPAVPMLDRAATTSLARAASQLPPVAAMRVLTTSRAGTLRSDSTLAREAVSVVATATNEESLVAANAYGQRSSGGRSPALARLMVSAGVALRAHAQDRAWFPGDPAASSGAVIGRYGLKAITFGDGVPSAWRPYYVQMIATALENFSRAVPGYQPTALSFRVELDALPDSALAMHDPRSHTIRLSALTPGGTLAHELAHDLDWQAARRLFAKNGGYATDRSVTDSTLTLSSSIRGLTAAKVLGRGPFSSHGSARPAEVFARSIDWFVADVLASMGRSDASLTAIEDPLLAGFAAAPADAASGDGAKALVRSLAEMTYVPDSLTAEYLKRWSASAPDLSAVMLRASDAPVAMRRSFRPMLGMGRFAADLYAAPLCAVDRMRDGSPEQRLVRMAIYARAEGIVRRRARFAPSAAHTDWAQAALGNRLFAQRVTDDMIRRTAVGVADGFGRAGLLSAPPAPFLADCGGGGD